VRFLSCDCCVSVNVVRSLLLRLSADMSRELCYAGYYESALSIVRTHQLDLICDTEAFMKGKIVEEGLFIMFIMLNMSL